MLTRRSEMVGTILMTGVFLGAGTTGVLFVVEPFLVALLVGGAALLFASSVKPHWVLALGLVMSLAGGSYSAWTLVGGLILLADAVVGLAFLISQRHTPPVGLLPMLVLGVLMVRFLVEGDQETPADILRCAAVVIAVAACRARRLKLELSLGVAGLGFVAASYAFGVSNEMGSRFVGVSGSPNRMVFGLLLFLPFILTLVGRSNPRLLRALGVVGSVGSVVLLLRSGSSQGIAGLTVILLSLVACFLATRMTGSSGIFWCLGGAVVVFGLSESLRTVASSSDLSTLSGRTPLYQAAVQEIVSHPWIGTGLQHVSGGGVTDRSAHSAILGVTAAGGVVIGILWLVILFRLSSRGLNLLSRGKVIGAVPLVLVVEQFVQAVEFIPLTWAVIAIFMTYLADNGFEGESESESDRVGDSESDRMSFGVDDGVDDQLAKPGLTRERAYR